VQLSSGNDSIRDENGNVASTTIPLPEDRAFSEYGATEIALQSPLNTFRAGEEVRFSVSLDEQIWNGSMDSVSWLPFVGAADPGGAPDMCAQLELVMLDVWVRRTLVWDAAAGEYCTSFVLPDAAGVYTARLNYQRSGYSTLHVELPVSVRPLRHDEHERFLPPAAPYYLSLGCALFVFSIFCILFLYT